MSVRGVNKAGRQGKKDLSKENDINYRIFFKNIAENGVMLNYSHRALLMLPNRGNCLEV